MIIMKLGNVKGDSKISGKTDWIALTDFSFDITREVSDSAKAGTHDLNLGIADLPPISVSKSLDIGSCDLFYHSINGVAIAKAEVHFMETMGEKVETYLRYTLDDPVIVSWNISGSEDDRPTESATIWYSKIRMEYSQFDPKGKKTSTHNRGWDRVTAKTWGG